MKNVNVFCVEKDLKDIIEDVDGGNFERLCKMWWGSRFKKVRIGSSIKTIGLFGESIVNTILTNKCSKDTVFSGSRGYDINNNGKRVEVKTSFISTSGKYCMNQIRPESDFDYIMFVCIDNKDKIRIFKWSKENVIKSIEEGNTTIQHSNGSNEETGLYNIYGSIDKIKKENGLREMPSLLQYIDDVELNEIIDNYTHNNMVLKSHLDGSIWEAISYSASKTGFFGKRLLAKIFSNFGISAKILNLNKQLNTINGGDVAVDVKTSIGNNDGIFNICQVRPSGDYSYLYFVALFNDDARIFKCSKDDVIKACEDGRLNNQHNNYKGDGKTGLFSAKGSIEELVKRFNFTEQ